MAGNGGPSNGTDLAPTRPQSLSRVPSKRKDTSKAFLIVIAMLVVGFLVVAAVAYLVYPRFTERSGPTFVVSPVGDAKPSNAAEVHSGVNGIKEIDPDKYQLARDAYESGVKHQEQAARLADAGQRAEANSESERAIAKYREAIQFFPRMAEAHENLGVAFYNTGRSDGAVSEYEIALQLVSSPTSQLLTNYGYALLGLKRFRDAADAFGRALKIEPSDYDLHFYRGSALYFAGDTLSAFAAYSEYLHLAPRGQYAEQARDFLAGRSVPADGAN